MSVIPDRLLASKHSSKDKAKLYREVIRLAKDPAVSYGEIAEELNGLGFKTPYGKKCDAKYVNNQVRDIRRLEQAGLLKKFLKEN